MRKYFFNVMFSPVAATRKKFVIVRLLAGQNVKEVTLSSLDSRTK